MSIQIDLSSVQKYVLCTQFGTLYILNRTCLVQPCWTHGTMEIVEVDLCDLYLSVPRV